MLQEAEYDFERRFDERRSLEWMQENWYVQVTVSQQIPDNAIKERGNPVLSAFLKIQIR